MQRDLKTTMGWAYLNPDTGMEWSRNHPRRSGEVEDASEIEKMTLGEFRKLYGYKRN